MTDIDIGVQFSLAIIWTFLQVFLYVFPFYVFLIMIKRSLNVKV